MTKAHVLDCGNSRRLGPYQGANRALRLTCACLPDRQAGLEARPGLPMGPGSHIRSRRAIHTSRSRFICRPFPEPTQGPSVVGEALAQVKNSTSKQHPLLFSEEQRYCDYSAEDSSIAGKIVVCEANGGLADKSICEPRSAGAAGVMLINANVNGYTTVLRD
ncbi:hypothetical protein C2845_PM02G16610 [Panicum miliaceum]|uniref:PA domain-containing protein n=1 Tax=Panicum miliaceum TaxID=4540 RepID=A0A3L6SCT3_PANMI|nr:hypothetical protein C2845_PM02G16610 [Panicum miliaceum]